MKKTTLLIIFSITLNLSFSQGTDILGAEQFCSGTSQLTFNNVFGGVDLTPVGCLGSIPNASYFFMEIDQPGDLVFTINQENTFGTPIDVDFIAWGPFTDVADANASISYTDCPTCPNNTTDPTFYPYAPDFITDCSFDFAPVETMNILNAMQGEIYVVLITNFNGSEGIINFQQTGGLGTTTCASLPVCGSQYFDIGGPTGNYAGNETTTINPYFPGGTVTVDFTAIDIPDAGDVLTVYNGPNNTFPVLGSVTGLPASFTSTAIGNPTGAITFEFISNNDANVGTGWEADITCTPPPTPPTCGSTFYDSGGASGNYSANELQTTTFYPDTPGDIVTATFTAFNIEAFWDDFYVYDGPNSTYPLLGVFSGTTIPGPFTSTDPTGALTFVFDSDGSGQYSGWAADITCSTPVCGTTVYDSGGAGGDYAANESETTTLFPDIPGDLVNITFTAFDTENSNDELSIYDGPDATYPLLGTFSGTSIPGPFTSSDFATGAITFVFTSNASIQNSGWAADVVCLPPPPPPTCGSTFYDSGGPSGNYSANELETTTLFPDTPGDAVTATFTAFNTEGFYDSLSIYDGPNDTYPLLGVFSGTAIPGPFTSSDPSGALTFVFDSDGSFQDSGWAADITCSSACNLIITDTVYPLGANECTLDYTELTTNATSSSNTIIYSEYFNAGTFGATGWTAANGATSANWIISNTTNAGGTANEAVLDWTSGSNVSTWTLTSPVIDITGNTNLRLSFKHDLWQFGTDFTIFLETSLNGTTWTPQYTYANPPDITETRNVDLSSLDGNNNLYIRFRFTGDSFDLFSWSIDDIVVTADGAPTPPEITWSPATGLFTDTTLTTPYVLGDFVGTVYAAPNSSETYIATDSNSCTDTIIITSNRKIWDGSTSDNWMEPTNWSDNLVPTPADCVVIPVTGNDPVIYDNDNGDGLNLTIEPGASLTLTSDTDANNLASSLTIQDFIDIQGTGILTVEDDASLIQVYDSSTTITPSAPNTGSIVLNRNTEIRQSDYVYWSSPVQGFDISNVYGGFTPTNYIYQWISTQTTPYTGPPPGNVPVIVGTWDPISSGTMTEGKGYIVRGPTNHPATTATATATFEGVPNNGVITQALSSGDYSGGLFTYNPYGADALSVTALDDNWNLLGNPYPSALDADTFLTHPNNSLIEGSVHIWTHGTAIGNNGDSFYDDFLITYSPLDYITYNLTGISNPNPIFNGKIGSGQGFFVLALNDNETGSVTFNNSMRDRTHRNTEFYRNSNEYAVEANTIDKHRIWLNLIDSNGTASSILVGYIEGATQEKDRLFDAYNREVNSLSMYSKIGDERMIIQGRAIPFDQNDQVPLGTVIPLAGNYTIAISNVDGLFTDENQSIYLEDTYAGVIHNLRAAPYTFTETEAVDYSDRFILRYTNDTLGLNELELGSGLTIVAPNSNYIKVNSQQSLIQNVLVYDLLGRVLFDRHSINQIEFILNDHNLSVGTYIVKATLVNGQSKAQKIVLKN
jgi:hypothetical protein